MSGSVVPIRILGVNEPGQEAGNAAITDGRDVPWLQDTVAEAVTARWGVTPRDVVVLDGENVPFAVYNLTVHDLADPAAYAELRDVLLAAAEASAP